MTMPSHDNATAIASRSSALPNLIQHSTYPLLLITTVSVGVWDIADGQIGRSAPYLIGSTVALLMTMERLWPMRDDWRMHWISFKRDLFFMLVGGTTIAAANWGLTLMAVHLAPTRGWLSQHAVWFSVTVGLLTIQCLQYALHRAAHELPGPIGAFLWRVHRAHHVSDRVYVLMHARFHPIDAILTRAAFIFPMVLLGMPAPAVYLINLIVGLHGLVGHLNVDLRAGWFNYLFVGTELHRDHHSRNREEAVNYGAFLSVFDLLFGTFHYRPGHAPASLGVNDNPQQPAPDAYATWAHLVYPFAPTKYERDASN